MSAPVLITGGAGFIGSNLARRLLDAGEQVVLFDDLSRPGVRRNAEWLREQHGAGQLELEVADVRDAGAVRAAVRRAGAVFHLAAQVAVTTSLTDPIADFEVNARGTLNVLEAARGMTPPPPLVFTSTNKVYGALHDLELRAGAKRYEPEGAEIAAHGIPEHRPLDFHSPYGCSKGAADQYVLDYARTFGLPALVFRMSCIYGPRQFGTEDQGWVAHIALRALRREVVTVYGDGRQVRDVLFVDDLVDAMLLARGAADRLAGRAFNIGGGPAFTLSLLELLELLELLGEAHAPGPAVEHAGWRPGDQRYYVSDSRRFRALTGWAPRVGVRDGVRRLCAWLAGDRPEAALGAGAAP